MTLGEKLKKLRIENALTQKDLADRLNVTFQTVSKWENDTNEPDFTTIKELSKILNCSIEYLFNDENNEEAIESKEEIKTSIGKCADCGRDIFEGEETHSIEKRSSGGVNEIVTVCDECFKAREEKYLAKANEQKAIYEKNKERKHRELFDDKKQLIASAIVGTIALAIALVACILNYQQVGLVVTIVVPIIVSYVAFATLYCILTSFIGEVFLNVSSWSIKFPGLIFSWNLEGFAWLIAMKILFAILGALFGFFVLLLAVAISAFLSIFAFVPVLIHNKKDFHSYYRKGVK